MPNNYPLDLLFDSHLTTIKVAPVSHSDIQEQKIKSVSLGLVITYWNEPRHEKTCCTVCEQQRRRLACASAQSCWLYLVFYGHSTHFRSFRARSVNLAILFLGKYQYLVSILSPVTDNCPSWISGRERMVVEIISWPNLNERMFCRTWGSDPRPSAYQADAHPIELPLSAFCLAA